MSVVVCESVLRERGPKAVPIVRDVLFIIQSGRIAMPAQLSALQDLSDSRDSEYWTKRSAVEKSGQGDAIGPLSRDALAISALRFAAEGTTIENIGEPVCDALRATDDYSKLRELAKFMLR